MRGRGRNSAIVDAKEEEMIVISVWARKVYEGLQHRLDTHVNVIFGNPR